MNARQQSHRTRSLLQVGKKKIWPKAFTSCDTCQRGVSKYWPCRVHKLWLLALFLFCSFETVKYGNKKAILLKILKKCVIRSSFTRLAIHSNTFWLEELKPFHVTVYNTHFYRLILISVNCHKCCLCLSVKANMKYWVGCLFYCMFTVCDTMHLLHHQTKFHILTKKNEGLMGESNFSKL